MREVPFCKIIELICRGKNTELSNVNYESNLDTCFTIELPITYLLVSAVPSASQRALPTETNVEGGTPQSKSGTSVNLSERGLHVDHCGEPVSGKVPFPTERAPHRSVRVDLDTAS